MIRKVCSNRIYNEILSVWWVVSTEFFTGPALLLVSCILQSVKLKMAAIDHGKKQVFTYSIHWSPSGLHLLMHPDRKRFMEVDKFIFKRMHVAFGLKRQKFKMATNSLLNKLDF